MSGVLVPVDGSDRSLQAVEYACVLFPDAEPSLLHVVDPGKERYEGPGYVEGWKEQAEREADSILEDATERTEEYGVDAETAVEWGTPYRGILEYIKRTGPDHVVLGSTGESASGRFALGSVSEVVLRRSSAPVTVVRSPPGTAEGIRPPERILTPLDGSEDAYGGLKYAIEQFPEADVTALVVCELDVDLDADALEGTYVEDAIEDARADAEEILSRAEAEAGDRGVDLRTETAFGRPAAAIVEYAESNDIEHVVVGSRGRSRVSRALLGSVAETVAKRASVPVTVFRS